jgi:hypothetical protein
METQNSILSDNSAYDEYF